jgi:hypothetical protein
MADAIRGNVRMPVWEFLDQWQEHAVLAVHKPGAKVRETSPLSLRKGDVELGELNRHLIQTQSTRQPVISPSLPP